MYDYRELVEEFCTSYTAGADTSAHMITMMFNYLYLHPDCMRKVRQEVDKYIGAEQDITTETMSKMTYIDAVQNETLRLYGPGNGIMLRSALLDHFVKDVPSRRG